VPDAYEGISFDENGVCTFCRASEEEARRDLPGIEALGERVRSLGTGGQYDCVVPLSGGKDSTYILYSAVKDLGLKPLAVNYDSGYQSVEGRENVRNACEALGVKLVAYGPDADTQRAMLREILEVSRILDCYTRTCTDCELMLRHASVRAAREYDVPVVLWGSASAESAEEQEYEEYRYGMSPGAIVKGKLRTLGRLKLSPGQVIRLIPHIVRYAVLNARQRRHMGVPLRCVLNPFGQMQFPESDPTIVHYFDYTTWDPSQNTPILERELGWKHPPGRDSRFDCRLYAFVEHRQLKLTGLSESGVIESGLVRHGRMSRAEALERERETRERVVRECDELVELLGVPHVKIDLPS
jgi:hypothetical protein